MKTIVPKEIQALSAEIETKKAEIETINADIERAQLAVAEADGWEREMEALTKKRAEQRAQAFVSRQPADMAELDSQLEALERSNRTVREEGIAAALAISLLETKRSEVESATAALQERRKQATADWLKERSIKAIDRYIEALQSLGPVIAEAAGADHLRRRFEIASSIHREPGLWLLAEIKTNMFPYPFTHAKQAHHGRVHPFDWMRDLELAERESEKIRDELAAAGFDI
jgi:chromosome segregation ATPase